MRRLRGAKDISQKRLAKEADIERAYVSRLERKMENPGILEKIAAALGGHVSELLVEAHGWRRVAALESGEEAKRIIGFAVAHLFR
jgi:transcriptional regulator with XRE-family HTH domain